MEIFGARPTYFVVRPDGARTALVEVDQLPDSIQIAGISADLPAIDAYNNMTCVGISERAPFQYIIDIIAAAAPNNYPSSTTSTANNNPPTTSSDARNKEQPPPPPPPKQQQQLVVLAGNGEDNREPRNGLSKNNKAQVSESRCR